MNRLLRPGGSELKTMCFRLATRPGRSHPRGRPSDASALPVARSITQISLCTPPPGRGVSLVNRHLLTVRAQIEIAQNPGIADESPRVVR